MICTTEYHPLPPLNAVFLLSSSAGVHVRVFAGAVSPSGPRVRRAVAVPYPGGPGRGGNAFGGVSTARADPGFARKEHGGGVAGDGGRSVSVFFAFGRCCFLFCFLSSCFYGGRVATCGFLAFAHTSHVPCGCFSLKLLWVRVLQASIDPGLFRRQRMLEWWWYHNNDRRVKANAYVRRASDFHSSYTATVCAPKKVVTSKR